jgi:hypothetical protein
MSRSRISPVLCWAAAAAVAVPLGACSDLYVDRRDTIALGAGDAIAANKVVQMVDPWPAASGNRNIAFNGQKMQSAVERYRTNRVIPPADPMAQEGNGSLGTQVNVSQATSGPSSQSGSASSGNSGQ